MHSPQPLHRSSLNVSLAILRYSFVEGAYYSTKWMAFAPWRRVSTLSCRETRSGAAAGSCGRESPAEGLPSGTSSAPRPSALRQAVQDVDCGDGETAELVRADVEHVIRADRGALRLDAEDLLHALVVRVGRTVPPAVVHRPHRLVELAGLGLVRDLVVVRREVVTKVVADPPVDEAARLVFPHEVAEAPRLLFRHRHRHVEPDEAEVAVLRQDLLRLRNRLLGEVALEVIGGVVGEVPVVPPLAVLLAPDLAVAGVVHPAPAAVRIAPVEVLRVIEPELYARRAARLGDLLEGIAPERRRVHDVVLRHLRAVHREAVVVLRGDDEVLHPRVPRPLHPVHRIEQHRVERLRERRVLPVRNAVAVHDPLAVGMEARPALPFAAEERVEPPVRHHPELRLPEPLLRGLERGGVRRALRRRVHVHASRRQRRRGTSDEFSSVHGKIIPNRRTSLHHPQTSH